MKHAIIAATLVLCATGCGSGKRIAKANDALRFERETQRERIAALESENAELKSKNSELNARLESPLTEDVLAAMPRVAGVTLQRASAIEIEGADTRAVFLLTTQDGQGRFVQAVGSVELRAVEIGEQGEDAEVLGERVVTPTELRDSYASGFGGPSYLLRVPLNRAPTTGVALRAILRDSVTGSTHEAERIVASAP